MQCAEWQVSQRRRAIARVIDVFWPGSARTPRLKRFLGVAEQPHQHSATSPVQPRLHWTLRQVGSAALPSPSVCPLSPSVSLILHTTISPCTASSSSSRRRPRPLTSSCQANDRERNNCRENQVDAPHPNLGRVDPNRLLSSCDHLHNCVVFLGCWCKTPHEGPTLALRHRLWRLFFLDGGRGRKATSSGLDEFSCSNACQAHTEICWQPLRHVGCWYVRFGGRMLADGGRWEPG